MALARYKQAGVLLNAVAEKAGLDPAPSGGAYSATDPDFVRLRNLLTDVGQDLAESHLWRHLIVVHTITGDGVTTDYDLPADFLDMVPQTGWNRSSRFPLRGPLDPQQWQYREAMAYLPVYAEFRLDTNTVRFKPALALNAVAAFEYRSRAWVRPGALGNGNTLGPSGTDEPTVDSDYVLFDPLLVRRALLLAWREENGLDTAKEQEAFQRTFDSASERTTTAPVLRLARRRDGVRLIDVSNIPEGNI